MRKDRPIVKGIHVQKAPNYTLVHIPRKMGGIVTFVGTIEGGSMYSPKDNLTLADITVMMLERGTKKRTKREIDLLLESMGASISFAADIHSIHFQIRCLPEFLPKILDVLFEELTIPKFSEKEFSIFKKQHKSKLLQSQDDTGVQSMILQKSELFPKSHPHYVPKLKTQIQLLEKTTVKDMKDFHRKVFGANSLKLVIVGGISKNDAIKTVSRVFGKWKEKDISPVRTDSRNVTKGIKKFIPLKDKATVDVSLSSRIDVSADSKSLFPLMIATDILGGPGLTGRLMSVVREKQGLTYFIYAGMPGVFKDINGYFRISASFAPSVLSKGIVSTKRVFKDFVDKGITKKEFETAHEKFIGRYVIQISTTQGLANRILTDINMGRDVNYINERVNEIRTVTRKDVNRAIKEHLKGARLAILGAGSVTSTGKPL